MAAIGGGGVGGGGGGGPMEDQNWKFIAGNLIHHRRRARTGGGGDDDDVSPRPTTLDLSLIHGLAFGDDLFDAVSARRGVRLHRVVRLDAHLQGSHGRQ